MFYVIDKSQHAYLDIITIFNIHRNSTITRRYVLPLIFSSQMAKKLSLTFYRQYISDCDTDYSYYSNEINEVSQYFSQTLYPNPTKLL